MTTPSTMKVTVNREEREVLVRDTFGDGQALDTKSLFLCRHRTGQKLHPTNMRFWRQNDGTYRADFSTVALNKQARIVAWRDDVKLTNLISNHSA
jgi:hypothetical protein